jgi:hypothetical protein
MDCCEGAADSLDGIILSGTARAELAVLIGVLNTLPSGRRGASLPSFESSAEMVGLEEKRQGSW